MLLLLFLTLFSLGNASDYYGFIPSRLGTVYPNSEIQLHNDCWKNITVGLYDNQLSIQSFNKKSLLCMSTIILGTHYHLRDEHMLFPTHNTYTLTDQEILDSSLYGVGIYQLNGSLIETLDNLYLTWSLFEGNKMEQYNVNFLKEKMNLTLDKPTLYPIPKSSELKSGDCIFIRVLDGLDPLIMWGTGSHVGHVAVFLNTKDGPYIFESTDVNPFGKAYWPPPYGFIKTPYNKWIKQAQAANFEAVVVKIQDKFSEMIDDNLDNILEWWSKNEGTGYGYPNFIWGWVDTINCNFPKPLDSHLFTLTVSFLDRYDMLTYNITQMIVDPLNKRLETYYGLNETLTWNGMLDWSYMTNTTLWYLGILPEKDNWLYENKFSRVCNTLILTLFKLVGIVPESIQVTEFTPKDFYQLKIWDNMFQILGKYQINLSGFNTIDFYTEMNQKCPTIPTKYERTLCC